MREGKGIFRNTLSQIASRVLVVLVSLLTTAILTRRLGLEGFGNYVFITSIVLLFVGLTDFGTTTIGVREASLQADRKKEIFGNIFGIRLLLSLVIFLLFNLLVYFLPQFNGLRQPACVASLVLVFLILRTTTQAILQVFLRLDVASFLEVSAAILILLFIGIFMFLKIEITISDLMWFWSVSALLSGVIGFFYIRKIIKIRLLFNKVQFLTILKQATPLGFYLLVYAVYDRGIDSFFLKTFSGSQAVGLYGLAYKVHGNLIFGAAFLMNSLFPLIARSKENFAQLSFFFKRAMGILLLSGTLILSIGLVIAPLVIKLIGGVDYYLSINILRILLFATFFSYLNHLNGYLMISLNEQKKLLNYSVVSLSLNLILNLILVPIYSFWGAAVVTVLTEGTIFMLTKRYLRKKYNLHFNLKDFQESTKQIFKLKNNYFNFGHNENI